MPCVLHISDGVYLLAPYFRSKWAMDRQVLALALDTFDKEVNKNGDLQNRKLYYGNFVCIKWLSILFYYVHF